MFRKLIISSVMLATTASAAFATGVQPRLGLGIDPDQFVFGVLFKVTPVGKIANFAPSVDLGVGDNVTTITGNFDFLFPLSLQNSDTEIYIGAGPTLAFYSFDGGDDSEVGISAVAGIELPTRSSTTLEVRIGIGDIPDLKFLVGFYL